MVSANGIEVDSRKVSAILEWPPPRNPSELMRFLGAANYFRRHIRRFSHLAAPLYELLKKERPWVWSDPQQQAFEAVRTALATAPIVRQPDRCAEHGAAVHAASGEQECSPAVQVWAHR